MENDIPLPKGKRVEILKLYFMKTKYSFWNNQIDFFSN